MQRISDQILVAHRRGLGSPVPPPDYLERPRLCARLRAGRGRRLTLVVAPAGFGKTTLLAGWLRSDGRPYAWLGLEDEDTTLTRMVRLLVDALQELSPTIGRRLHLAASQGADASPAAFAQALADEATRLADGAVVVLDDYQAVASDDVHAFVASLIRRLPPNVQLVIATREQPPLPIAVLRGRGELVEVSSDDLRFDPDEAEAFLTDHGHPFSDPSALTDLVQRADGWAVGLRLSTFGHAGGRHSLPRGLATATAAGRHAIDEYLLSEVLDRQLPEVQSFLLRTSILDRLCGRLCAALADTGTVADGSRLLDQLRQRQLFLTPLGEDGEWFQYHQLLRDALCRRLEQTATPREIRDLHARASSWYAEEGLTDEAIHHALAANDTNRAADLAEAALPSWLQREQWASLHACLERLPRHTVAGRPFLGLAECRLLVLGGQFGDLAARLDHLDELLRQEPPPLPEPLLSVARGQVHAQGSYALAVRGLDDARAHDRAALALQQLPPTYVDMRAVASMMFAVTRQMLGRGDEALEWLRDQVGRVSTTYPTWLLRLLLGQAYVELGTGRLTQLGATGRQMVAVASAHALPNDIAWGRYALGRAAYERNDIQAASEHFTAGLAFRDETNLLCVWNTTVGLARALAASGRLAEARQLALDALDRAEQTHRSVAIESLRSLNAHLALAAGRMDAALEWLEAVPPDPRPLHAFDIEDPLVTRARVLLAHGSTGARQQAAAILDQALRQARARSVGRRQIEVLAVQALVYADGGDVDRATRMLAHAMDLATPGRHVRLFVDLGPPLAELIRTAARRGHRSAIGERVLAAASADGVPAQPVVPSRADGRAEYVEPLTWRELEVLQLLAARYSNKEIAATLYISWETVKKHAASIYGKLQVAGRREAVIRARALGLIREELRHRP